MIIGTTTGSNCAIKATRTWMIQRLTTTTTGSTGTTILAELSHSLLWTPILGIGRRYWMSGPMQSWYYNYNNYYCYYPTSYFSTLLKRQQLLQQQSTISTTTPASNSCNNNNQFLARLLQQRANTVTSQQQQQKRLIPIVQRIQKNIARLYARRILEIAIASAALQRYKLEHRTTLLEGTSSSSSSSITATTDITQRPMDWENWKRKEFQTELLQQIGTNTISRLWSATGRIVTLSCLLLPFTVLTPLSYISTTVHDVSWKYALWSIEQAGPTFIKLFQWATTRQDLFSSKFCTYFSTLQDHTSGHDWQHTLSILQQDLLLPLQLQKQQQQQQQQHDNNNTIKNNNSASVLSATSPTTGDGGENLGSTNRNRPVINVNEYISLYPQPIGSGCIAQVYYGTLRKPVGQYNAGTEIAVKVQHPGVVHKVCVDFYIFDIGAQLLEAIPYLNLSFLSLVDTVHKFRDIMIPQLDLSIEAKHLDRFNRDFHADPHVTFPKPIHEFTSPRILTETFIHGTPILHYVNASESDRKEIALLGVNTTLKMIFINDFLHGDLHPGNILISRDMSVSGHPLRLHLLDCGLVVEMGPEQHVNLVKILGAFARRNGRLAGQLMVDTSSDCQASPIDIELFVKGIEHIVVDDENNNFLEKVGDYITDICYLACQKKVKLEASFINAALAVEIMEGIATALYPDLKVTKVALPLVVQAELMHRLPKLSIW